MKSLNLATMVQSHVQDDRNIIEPYISVIITAFNRKEYLIKAVRSVLDQTLSREHFEIIVTKNFVDIEIDKFLQENNVRTLLDFSNKIGMMLYNSVNETKGDVIAFLDDDDLFDPDKLHLVFENFKNDPFLVYFHNSIRTIDPLGKQINHPFNQTCNRISFAFKVNALSERKVIWNLRPDFNNSSISIKKSIFSSFISDFETLEDVCLFAIACESKGVMKFETRPLTYYRVHSSTTNISSKNIDFAVRNEKLWRRNRLLLINIKSSCSHKICLNLLESRILEADLHLNLLNISTKRRKRILSSYDAIRSFSIVRDRPFLLTVFLHMISIVMPKTAFNLFRRFKEIS